MDLDKEIIKVQQSTRTLFRVFAPIHDWLRLHNRFYYSWSVKSYSRTLHWAFLFLYLVSIPFFYFIVSNQKPVISEADLPLTYDVPRWETVIPKATTNPLNGVVIINSNDIWTVGDNGTILNYVNGSTWKQNYSGTNVKLNDISAADTANIWIVGDSGKIFKTTNGGASWSPQLSGVTAKIGKIKAVNDQIAWAIDDSNEILKTIDGGNTWVSLSSGVATGIYGIDAIDANTAWIAGASNVIRTTTNGGLTWTPPATSPSSPSEDYFDISLSGSDVIWISGSTGIFRTADRGQTWLSQTGRGSSIKALNDSTAWAEGCKINYSSNVLTWDTCGAMNISHQGVSLNSYDIDPNGQTAWAVGLYEPMNGVPSYKWPEIVSTSNGIDWADDSSTQVPTNSDNLFAISFANDNVGWAVGWGALGNFSIYKTDDGGVSWGDGLQDQHYYNDTGSLTGITSGTESGTVYGWVAGTYIGYGGNSEGIIYKLDATNPPVRTEVSQVADLNDVSSWDSAHAIAIGSIGKIIRTTNGTTWQLLNNSGTTKQLSSISCLKVNGLGNCFAAGENETILKTVDGGDHWSQVFQGNNSSPAISSIKMINSTTIWAAAGDQVLRSVDSGATWPITAQITNTSSVTLVDAADQNNAIAIVSDNSTGYVNSYVRTSDGGQTWSSPIKISDSLNITNISSQNPYSAWAVDSMGVVMHYITPLNATGSKLFVALPGQSFSDGYGIVNQPSISSVRAGQSVNVGVHVADSVNSMAKGVAYRVGFTSSDPGGVNPAEINLNGDIGNEACNAQTGERIASPCGSGTASYIFHTVGPQTITANDSGGSGLTPGTSASISVTPADPSALRFTSTSVSLSAGTGIKISLGLADPYGNATSDTNSSRRANLTRSSSTGKFSSSSDGPWADNLDVIIPAGTPAIDANSNQTVDFYYLDFSSGSSNITATSIDGLTLKTMPVNVTVGNDLFHSVIVPSDPLPIAGNSIDIAVTLKDSNDNIKLGYSVHLYSSRGSKDAITPNPVTTDGNGVAHFSLSSELAGDLTLTVKDETDNTWLSNETSVLFLPDKVSKINLATEKNITDVNAGISFDLTSKFFDQYSNVATNSRDTIKLSSTDKNATLPGDYTLTDSDSGTHIFAGLIFKSAGKQTITVTDQNTGVSSSVDITVGHGSPSVEKSTFTADKVSLLLNNKDNVTLTVKLLDDFDNVIPEKTIKVSYDSSKGKTDKDTVITNSNGIATFVFTPSALGDVTFSAHDQTDNFDLSNQVKITILTDTLLNQLTSTISNITNALRQSEAAKTVANVSKNVSLIAAIIGFLPILANALGSAPAAAHAVTYGFSLSMQALGVRKKRKTWGRVFDSTTGKGVDLALVRLYDQETMKLKGTIVTDIQGKYHFQIEPGNYVLTVSHKGYIFPTQIFAKYGIAQIDKTISKVNNQYVGQTISIGKDETLLNIEIPIDPAHKKVSPWLRFKIAFSSLFETVLFTLSYILIPVLVLSSLLSIFTAIILPDQRNIVLAILYSTLAAFYIVSRMVKNRHFSQVINRDTKKPISSVAVSLFDKEYGTLKETRITDRFGRFSIFAQKGEYYLKAEKDGCTFSTEKKHDKEIKMTKGSKLIYKGENISLREPSFIGVVIEGKSERSEVL